MLLPDEPVHLLTVEAQTPIDVLALQVATARDTGNGEGENRERCERDQTSMGRMLLSRFWHARCASTVRLADRNRGSAVVRRGLEDTHCIDGCLRSLQAPLAREGAYHRVPRFCRPVPSFLRRAAARTR